MRGNHLILELVERDHFVQESPKPVEPRNSGNGEMYSHEHLTLESSSFQSLRCSILGHSTIFLLDLESSEYSSGIP